MRSAQHSNAQAGLRIAIVKHRHRTYRGVCTLGEGRARGAPDGLCKLRRVPNSSRRRGQRWLRRTWCVHTVLRTKGADINSNWKDRDTST